MPPPSLARNFFEQIIRAPDPVAVICGLVNSNPPTFESDWLDFKTEDPNLNPKQRDKKVPETWSEAIGGFANNQVGVLIWGIDARKTKRPDGSEIDAAYDEKPVTSPFALKSRLIELQRGATDPPLANVEVEAYEHPDHPGTGFVVCYVPEGPFKPYRSEQAGQQWFLRAGDDIQVMPSAVLRAMFYPRSKAVFRARASLSWELVGTQKDIAAMSCTVELVNDGTATARNALVVVQPDVQMNRGQLRYTPSDLWVPYSRPPYMEFEATRLLHLGRVTSLFSIEWEVEARPSSDHRVVPHCPAPSFDLVVYCENQEPQLLKVKFDTEEMIASKKVYVEAAPLEDG